MQLVKEEKKKWPSEERSLLKRPFRLQVPLLEEKKENPFNVADCGRSISIVSVRSSEAAARRRREKEDSVAVLPTVSPVSN